MPLVKKKPSKIKELLRRRRKAVLSLLNLEEKHSDVFEEHRACKEEITNVEIEIKDELRSKYPEGAERGIFTEYEDEEVQVTVTVKYGRDSIDPDKLRKKFPDLAREVIVSEERVDMDVLRGFAEDSANEEDMKQAQKAIKLLSKKGEYMTPAVTIRQKLETDTVVEE